MSPLEALLMWISCYFYLEVLYKAYQVTPSLLNEISNFVLHVCIPTVCFFLQLIFYILTASIHSGLKKKQNIFTTSDLRLDILVSCQ